jgi:membrane-bound lytic murein transglycosylase D
MTSEAGQLGISNKNKMFGPSAAIMTNNVFFLVKSSSSMVQTEHEASDSVLSEAFPENTGRSGGPYSDQSRKHSRIMKKTKKVISYIMLLVPLSLPAACSPINTGGGRYSSGGSDQQAETDEAEQLRLIVERYFEQQEQRQAEAVPQWIDVTDEEEDADDSPNAFAVESEQDLQDELEGLKKTGEWTAVEPEGGTRCDLPAPSEEPVWPEKRIRPEVAELDEADLDAIVPELNPSSQAGRKTACGFPVVVNKQVEYYLNLFQGRQRKNFRRWLERSGKYLPFITQELNKAGLPLELAWLAMIESGFNPSAYSRSHASGLWQFIPGTGRNFGLRVDSWADERRDPEKATKAAISYLKSLYKRFGDWHLAIAAYNAGEGSIERGLKKHKDKNFWELAQHDYLALETKRYVPQMIAAVLISRDPEQYGFRGIRYRRPVRHEVVKVPAGTPLKTVAASAAVSLNQLRELNNDLLRDRVPNSKGGWLLKVPAGRSALVAANLPGSLHDAGGAQEAYRSHKVAKNETLSGISEKYHVSMTDLLKVNNLRSSKLLAGQYLRIPGAAVSADRQQYALADSKKRPVEAQQTAAADTTTTYKMGKGETLSHVSDKYKVSVAALMKWNNISKASSIQAGRKLTIHLPQSEIETGAVQLASAAAEVPQSQSSGLIELTASGAKMKPGSVDAPVTTTAAAEQKSSSGGTVTLSGRGKRKTADVEEAAVSYYKVRNGDSLWSISKKLQVSTNDIKDWNSLNGNLLQPGTTLVIRNG